jgi:Holliday junction DNA helicase RuvA
MIVFLRGILAEKTPQSAVVEAGGVGYLATIPLSTFDRLPDVGESVKLFTEHVVREDDELLFGFATEEERSLYRLLVSVNGVGPKLAISVLSGISPRDFTAAVQMGDVRRLSAISGVGKKIAERLVHELKNSLGGLEPLFAGGGAQGLPFAGSPADPRERDAAGALGALGYKPQEAVAAVRAAIKTLPDDADVEVILRAVLSARAGARRK